MTVKLFLRPSPTASDEGQFQWGLFSYVGEPLGAGESTLDELIATVSQNGVEDVWVHYIIPASLVTLCRTSIPARQARFIQQALPFAVEESLAEDVEGMHLIIASRTEKDVWPVLAISHESMAEYYSLVTQLPWPLSAIYADAEGVPGEPGVLSLVIDGDSVLIHEPGHLVMRLLKENTLAFLEVLGSTSAVNGTGAEKLLKVYVNNTNQEDDRVLLAQLEHVQGLTTEIPVYGVTPFELVAHTLASSQRGTNFCQGQYRSQATDGDRPFQRWWPLAAAAAFFLAVQTALFLGEGYLHRQHAETYQAQALQLYQQIYPGERSVLSPRRQLEGKLRSAGEHAGQADFLKMLAEAGFQLKQQEDSQTMQLNNLQYNQRGELALEVRAATLDQLDRYKQALNNAGYVADLGSAIKESDGVRGRVTVRGG
jgi:general secretion pathway protein L